MQIFAHRGFARDVMPVAHRIVQETYDESIRAFPAEIFPVFPADFKPDGIPVAVDVDQ